MRALSPLLALPLLACASDTRSPPTAAPEPAPGLVLTGGRAPGGAPLSLWLDGRVIRPAAEAPASVPREDVRGAYLAPAVIDGHTHLTYVDRYVGGVTCGAEPCSAQRALLAAGVAAAVDLAAPLDGLPHDGPLRAAFSGPMITAPGGYPTRGWGSEGFGLEVADAGAARAAVDTLAAAGATWVKLPLHGPTYLDPEAAHAAVQRAHALGLRVAVHAPSAAAVQAAIDLDADLLAHAPVEPLPDHLATAWAPRAVVSTFSSFSRGPIPQANLRKLREAGARLLYGTDLGNGTRPEISAEELSGLLATGLSPAEVLEAATKAPAEYFGFDDLGALEPGKAACVLVLGDDPLEDPTALARPRRVVGEGCAR